MNPSNPEWYEELQGHPLKTKDFTEQLAWRIREKARSGTRGSRRRWARFASVGAVLLGTAALLILLFPTQAERAVAPEAAPSLAPSSPLPEDSPISDEDLERITLNPTPSDADWQRLIRSEKNYFASAKREMIGKIRADKDMAVFWKTEEGTTGDFATYSLGYSQYEWEYGRKDSWGHVSSASASRQKDNEGITQLESWGASLVTDFDVFDGQLTRSPEESFIYYTYGMAINPRIKQVRAIDLLTNQAIELDLVNRDGTLYWYGLLPHDSDEYKLEGIDADGRTIVSENRYY